MRPSRSPGARATLASLLLALSACASTSSEIEWQRVESSHFVAADGRYAVELPSGWLRSGNVLARDPAGANVISFNGGPVLTGDMSLTVDASSPQLLQAVSDQLAAQPGIDLLECRAVTLDGLPGFRAHFTADEGGSEGPAPAVRTEHVLYSAVDGEMLYAFALEAPPGDEFARDLADFEALVASFKRLPAAP